ncbi:aldehyde ferredoxin oxidoreductase family protein [Desulfitibacter alkalitolerans]|uniref:aldehyde ferredoxin oxidoreductase family protein n=1 Tax=Desulfitibacter alkalitolerans TaxID=264641 RepID=UPI000484B16B|nr:aldehyde ferredoxin oxidoreductase family protein [Desulfitibacter alkalitolerans]
MSKLYGAAGKMLRINLTEGTIEKEDLSKDLYMKYIGGRGLGAYFLTKEVEPDCDPLGTMNKLMFFNGPFSGTMAPGNNKINVTFKSPLTNTYSYSLAGGHWGPELKFAGYDGMIIEGKSEKPVYIWIDDDKVEIKTAETIWGNDIHTTDKKIKDELGDSNIHVAAIGLAGENLVKFACITNDVYREFGRGGCGAVMGSKNLKAIAVRGSKDVEVADPKGLMEYMDNSYPNFKKHPKAQVRRKHGTNELVEHINPAGFMCTDNFSKGYADTNKEFEGDSLLAKVYVSDAACYGCPIACSKNCSIVSTKYGKVMLEGPEFETVGLLGTNCGLTNWEDVLKVSAVCDALGMDSMTSGGCISLAMECFEKGILTLEDTGGLELRFGNGEAEAQLLEMIAKREGIGAVLAEGPVYAAEKWGVPDLVMHSKGMTPAVYDPRGAKGMGLTYAISPKGAHHMVAPVFGLEMAAGNRFEEKGKAELVKNVQFNFCILDSVGMCSTNQTGFPRPDQLAAFKLITGQEMTEQEILLNVERIINMERMFNVKNGFSRKDDTLPKRFTEETMSCGESKGQVVDLDTMLSDYYSIMGWDEDGIPTPEKLKELEL